MSLLLVFVSGMVYLLTFSLSVLGFLVFRFSCGHSGGIGVIRGGGGVRACVYVEGAVYRG